MVRLREMVDDDAAFPQICETAVRDDTVIFEGDVAGGANLYGECGNGVFVISYSSDDFYNFRAFFVMQQNL